MIALLTLGPLCWMIGGTGWKPARRFAWPLLATVLLWCPVAMPMGLTMVAVNCLPYGDRSPWWRKWLTFTALGLPTIWLDDRFGFGWALGMGVVLTAIMALSQKWGRFTHKLFEFSAGALQAMGLILGCLR